MDQQVLRAIINHVFLPRKLPDRADEVDFEGHLVDLLASSLSQFAINCKPQAQIFVREALGSIKEFQTLIDEDGNTDKDKLSLALKQCKRKGRSNFPALQFFTGSNYANQTPLLYPYMSKLRMPPFL